MSDANTQTGFRQDITEQPEVLHRALDAYSGKRRGDLENAAQLLTSTSALPVLLGMGTSQYLCLCAAYSFAAQQLPVSAPEAAEWIHYLAPAQPAVPTLVVSCSGESAECVRAVNETKAVIGIFNTLDSTIGRPPRSSRRYRLRMRSRLRRTHRPLNGVFDRVEPRQCRGTSLAEGCS